MGDTGRNDEQTKSGQVSRKQKWAIDIALKFLKIVVIREARNQNGVPLVGCAIKETVSRSGMKT